MDLLSRLLALMPVAGRLDVRCHFGAPWRIDEPGAKEREIRYHVLIAGRAIVEDAHGAPVALHAGDIVLFPSGSAHVLHDGSGAAPAAVAKRMENGVAIETNAGDGATADVLCGRFLLPAVPQRLLRENLPARLVVHSTHDGAQPPERLVRLIALLRDEAYEAAPGSESLVNHLSGALFGLTLRYASAGDAPPRGLLALAQRPRLQPAIDAMFEAPGKPWTLPELAELCHMSRATFARHFDEAIGRSAADVLTDIRMTLAGRMLAQGNESVAEIGEFVGYQSDAAFQRGFKRHVGMTPAQWRSLAHEAASGA
ncbi:RCS-specific HTH-type transcriptional activator RclR [Paraburkholderia hiiakae]|uniref:RCS-specific HTH-type transcriptional activator RclR n=1 Tax=Paraburkholderia hiiakae TaxID=1081782 RepID=A0ABM8P4R8_9BURK|nr:AraC family transcriptional regulator [Paraburkholderia hiiakae]CAD6556347.1 RCS-specific HTH-type transcriptional activator RclR [Paraburkholderia hiiakae]